MRYRIGTQKMSGRKSSVSKGIPKGRLTILFVALATLSIVTLLWMGVRLVQQDRTLEQQRLDELREMAADDFVGNLKSAIQEERAHLNIAPTGFRPVADDIILLVASPGKLQVFPDRSLLYYPVAFPGQEPDSSIFQNAERFEFAERDHDRAITSLHRLTKSEDAAVRAGALLRLARNLRKAGRLEEALSVYGELSCLPPLKHHVFRNTRRPGRAFRMLPGDGTTGEDQSPESNGSRDSKGIGGWTLASGSSFL